jgi:hypothetical protein
MATLISSAVRSPTAMPYSRRMKVWMAASMSKLNRRAPPRSATTPPRLMSAVSEVPPPTSMTMLAMGSFDRQVGADGRRHGLLDELGVGGAGPAGRLGDGSPLDLGDGRRHADDHLRGRLNRLTPARCSSRRIMRWVISKSVMAPWRSGRTATM